MDIRRGALLLEHVEGLGLGALLCAVGQNIIGVHCVFPSLIRRGRSASSRLPGGLWVLSGPLPCHKRTRAASRRKNAGRAWRYRPAVSLEAPSPGFGRETTQQTIATCRACS